MNLLHSTLDTLRDRFAPLSHTSTFRQTGQVTPEEFLAAGDYLVYKFPTWSWSAASTSTSSSSSTSSSRRVAAHLPPEKQFLVTRGVPCARRLDENFAGNAGVEEDGVVRDGFSLEDRVGGTAAGGEDDGWLRTGGALAASPEARVRDVRTLGEREPFEEDGGDEEEEEEEIPDMEDEEDDKEAIIREHGRGGDTHMRTYTLYITYTPYYRTPRLYLSGYSGLGGDPLPPHLMMQDIVGDYADKTVTLEDFPFFDAGVKMASIHPCKHASVMKVLLDRADAALKIRLEKMRRRAGDDGGGAAHGGGRRKVESGMEGLVDEMSRAEIEERRGHAVGVVAAGGGAGDEWEVLQSQGEEEEVAIRVDQYLVVFLKFMASVTPGMNYDFTMGL